MNPDTHDTNAVDTNPTPTGNTMPQAVEKPRSTAKKWWPFAVAAAVVASGALMFGLNGGFGSSTPTNSELLRAAYENSMQKTSALLEYRFDIPGGEEGGLEIDAFVDYTDISSVQSRGSMTLQFGEGDPVITDYVTTPDATYVRPTSLEQTETDSIAQYDSTWFRVAADEDIQSLLELQAPIVAIYSGAFAVETAQGINTVRGEFPDGNFNDTQRATIMALYDDEQPFEVEVEDVVYEKEGVRIVEATAKSSGINAIDDAIVGITDERILPGNEILITEDTAIKLYIDEATQRVVRAELTEEDGTVLAVELSEINEPVDIAAPDNSLDISVLLDAMNTAE